VASGGRLRSLSGHGFSARQVGAEQGCSPGRTGRLYKATPSAARRKPSTRDIYHRLKDEGKPERWRASPQRGRSCFWRTPSTKAASTSGLPLGR